MKTETSFANVPAHNADHVSPSGSLVIQGTHADGREWRLSFRSSKRFHTAAEAERAALSTLPAEERAVCDLRAYRVIGSGLDARTEAIRI